ncbi:TonB-dependent receptor [uncultured Bacteroides sp.]|uniref:TonB-dependent receptor n=1 Tax=uncultured Bacteroides sp. TaxID=162156 RepID=UPI002AA7DDB9|nr:TonB-dependent receptor [uncultured Bacteroides sp.]
MKIYNISIGLNSTILLGSALLISPIAEAQTQAKDTTMNRTVVVEQEYNPDIRDAWKINRLPKVEDPVIVSKKVEYDTTSLPIESLPVTAMKIQTKKEEQKQAEQGYARLGYGNYGNLDARINYLFNLSQRDRLTLFGTMDGMNGQLTKLQHETINQTEEKWDARFYRTQAGTNYLHQFNLLDLDISAKWQQENFNYGSNLMESGASDKQAYTSGEMHIGIESKDETLPLQFSAETNFLIFNKKYSVSGASAKENIVQTKANVAGKIDDQSKVNISMQMDNLFYSSQFENYTSLQLNPYYEFKNDNWQLHLGAHTDLAFNYGKSVRVAPDIAVNYLFADSYILYASATGGKMINDFRRMEQIHPYSNPEIRMSDSYEQLNATIGMKSSPFTGFWFNLYGGYKTVADDISPTYNGMITFTQGKTKSLLAGLKLSYQYKNLFDVSAEGCAYHWDKTDEDLLLIQKPAFNLKLNANTQVTSKLNLKIGYDYTRRTSVAEATMPTISNLTMGGYYALSQHISIYAKVENLLNKKLEYYYSYPAERINFIGGLSFHF